MTIKIVLSELYFKNFLEDFFVLCKLLNFLTLQIYPSSKFLCIEFDIRYNKHQLK